MEAQDFHIEPRSHTPIVQQLVDQVLALTAAGRLVPGSDMPSVRAVALALGVHAMTVSAAYQRLVALGVLDRRRGARLMVTGQGALASSDRLRSLEPQLQALARQAVLLQLDPELLARRLRELADTGG
jgi:GntR family transcriptional regulator